MKILNKIPRIGISMDAHNFYKAFLQSLIIIHNIYTK